MAGWGGRRSLTSPLLLLAWQGLPLTPQAGTSGREQSAPCSPPAPLAPLADSSRSRARWERKGVRLREECWQATHRAPNRPQTRVILQGNPPCPKNLGWGEDTESAERTLVFHLRTSNFLSLFLWPGCGCSRELRTWGVASPPRVFPNSITDKQLINERGQILPIHVCPGGKHSAPGWAPQLSGRHLVWTPENTLTANSHAGRHGSFCRLRPVHSRTALSC